jgi:hypothetical protein
MAFRLKLRRTARTELKERSYLSHLADPEEIGTIQGQTPGSKEEWRVAVALWEMGADFEYQYIIGEGRPSGAKGIFKLDFLIYTKPKPVGLEVQSVRWHSAQFNSTEQFRIAYIEKLLRSKILFIWEDQLVDQQTATEEVRKILGQYL